MFTVATVSLIIFLLNSRDWGESIVQYVKNSALVYNKTYIVEHLQKKMTMHGDVAGYFTMCF